MNSLSSSWCEPFTTEHTVQASAISQAFKVKVLQPMRRADESERFPVLYTTDADEFFGGLEALSNILQLLGATSRFILVGIGYGSARAARLLRWRDFVSHSIRARYEEVLQLVAAAPVTNGVEDLSVILKTTDANDFLHFIRAELMPFIDAHYPVVEGDNSYYGYSAGGGFGIYTLFTQPDTFRRYILGSPATSYDGENFAIELADAFASSGSKMRARVFLCVGEHEEFEKGFAKLDLVSGYYLLAKYLRQLAIPGLELSLQTFPGEIHATAWTMAFSRGLQAFFPPAGDIPYLPGLK